MGSTEIKPSEMCIYDVYMYIYVYICMYRVELNEQCHRHCRSHYAQPWHSEGNFDPSISISLKNSNFENKCIELNRIYRRIDVKVDVWM